jgi:heat shock protein HslJ
MKNLIILFSLFIVASCQDKASSESLFSQRWELVKTSGNDLKGPHEDEEPFLSFSEHDRSLSGYTGCNRLAGSFHFAKDGELAFAQTAATKRFCENSLEEQLFLQNLSLVKTYEIKDGTLFMYDQNKLVVLQFSGKAKK